MAKCVNCIHYTLCRWSSDDNDVSCIDFLHKDLCFEMPPCKIGDFVWAIREYGGVPHAQQGKIIDMMFTKDMELLIVVSHIARGHWGEKIFATQEEAEAKIKENKDAERDSNRYKYPYSS